MYKNLFLLILSLLVFSCERTNSKKAGSTFIGGVIENPKGNYVMLYQNEHFLDSVKLDKNNRFSYKNDSLCEGLYTFRHREYQRFYLKPKDSLLLHVNTIDFDESLKYSGIGSEKNNLLMKIFLEDEKVQKKLPEWFNLPPEAYLNKLDSVNVAHKSFHKKYHAKHIKDSDDFHKMISANLIYDGFLWKEMYISANLISGNSKIQEELPEAFLSHRKQIDYGNDLLRSHYSYYRFMNTYYNNLAFDVYKDVSSFDTANYVHANAKLEVVQKMTHHETLRNRLLQNTAVNYLLHTTNSEKAQLLFNQFKKYSTDQNNIEQLQHILDQTTKLVPGNKIPNVQLVSLDNKNEMLLSIIKKPTVIYFWTYESTKHYREVHEKADYLKVKYPQYDFIAINADDHFRKWKRIVETISTDQNTEYQLNNLPSAKSVLILDIPERTIIVDKNGKIKNANAAITDAQFEEVLK